MPDWLNDSPCFEYTKLKPGTENEVDFFVITYAFSPPVYTMFTGVIEDIGDLVKTAGSRFTFSVPDELLDSMEIGDSISVNGVCLTAVNIETNRERLSSDISQETRNKTNIGDLKPGDKVNLELPLGVGEFSDRLDGHLVQGHVDTLGKIGKIEKKRDNYEYRISTSRQFSHLLANKGSVAVDGISLTPYQVTGGTFSVSVIPHTYENTTLQFKHSGSKVNIEFDILAKYIRNSVNETNPYRE